MTDLLKEWKYKPDILNELPKKKKKESSLEADVLRKDYADRFAQVPQEQKEECDYCYCLPCQCP